MLLRHVAMWALPGKPAQIGVAVSGGGDSMSLLHLFLAGRAGTDRTYSCHGRSRTADPALRQRQKRSVPGSAPKRHRTCHLNWQGWDGHGNLPAEARRARLRADRGWARATGRRARRSGPYPRRCRRDLCHAADAQGRDRRIVADGNPVSTSWCRLGAAPVARARADLRRYLVRHGLDWIEDPSNEDETFERTRCARRLTFSRRWGSTSMLCRARQWR